ncbi:hypothetical protein CEUSTIGMA_g13716.t1 [Chlamydomonas eustigma]|uniref:Vesicle transport v-SNARE N-terminal domain-containing protein n=1 Tax=Chlamydomonas eustigma TaxID=1157962 RepID=A0A250XTA9_9CHLO|nr:hypothetical protein CEUSTIGMA_g13716.t1 [Chlamydomonas eustigma]|eukprot:GAX86304.1 hypothetical protein CEUSTIGMA_g13716.t1 [Chlamydomonas eustigma]
MSENRLFTDYENDFKCKAANIKLMLSYQNQSTNELQDDAQIKLDLELRAAEAIVKALELEAQSEQLVSQRAALQKRTLACKSTLSTLFQQRSSVASSSAHPPRGMTASTSDIHKKTLYSATQRLESSNNRLAVAAQGIQEAQVCAAATLEELQRQRQVLLKSMTTLVSAKSNVDKAGSNLKVMNQRANWFFWK